MRVAVVFPGQGSQFPEMVEPWTTHPVSAAIVGQASEILGVDLAVAVREMGALSRTDVTQLAMVTCGVAAWRVLEAEGVRPVAVAGHSLGQYAALVAAGAADFRTVLEVVQVRAHAMQHACERRPGAMLAVMRLAPDDAAAICGEAAQGDVLVMANENHPDQSVLSGDVAAIERAAAAVKARGGAALRLPVAGAFHSPLMEAAGTELTAAILTMGLRNAEIPVVENATAQPTTDAGILRQRLCRHIVSPVRWSAGVATMSTMGVNLFVEAGPGDVLTRSVRRCLPGAAVASVGTPEQATRIAEECTVRSDEPHVPMEVRTEV